MTWRGSGGVRCRDAGPAVVLSLLAALAMLLAAGPAAAGTAIYYSAPEHGYGWCSEVGGSDETSACARRYCEQSGNADCKLVLACGRGWAAIAETDNEYAHAAACAGGNPAWARHRALLLCIAATGRRCHTAAAFLGSTEIGEARNRAFDLVWYAQVLLAVQGYDVGPIDGAAGPRLRRAVARYQGEAGLPQTGEVSAALLDSLLAHAGGLARFAAGLRRNIEANRDEADPGTEFVSVQPPAEQARPAPDAQEEGEGRDGGTPAPGGDAAPRGGDAQPEGDAAPRGGEAQPDGGGAQPDGGGAQPDGGEAPAGEDDRSPGGSGQASPRSNP